MGDMADFYLDMELDATIDAEMLELDREDEYPHACDATRGVRCRCCLTPGLRWGRLDDKWRLFDATGLHHCPVRPLHD